MLFERRLLLNFLPIAFACAATILVAPISVIGATSTQVEPAGFGANEEAFKREFDVSEYKLTEEIIIRCGSRVEEDGRVRALLCQGEPERGRNTRRAIRKIQSILRSLPLEPAKISGIETQVWYNFAVIMTPGSSEVQIINNHLHNRESFGEDYIAPQRYGYPSWRGCLGMPESGIFVEARVSSEGTASDINVIGGRQGYASCITRASNNIQNSRFIPAFSNGVPVDAIFVELFK